ncbi:vpr protein [Simian immunodeficiency virus]|uniref:Vpr protein n=1 Tax=Simian immunodeficiency virus TaxID=11723 RepID=Q699W5_SIV|nr:vpr protein [Simian immunodeficiency virus]
MERYPPSHPPHFTSRTIPMTRLGLQQAMQDLNEEALKHFTREELFGVWNHCVDLPAQPDWTGEQAWAASVIDYIKIVQKMLWLHLREACFHREREATRGYPNIRPLTGRNREVRDGE